MKGDGPEVEHGVVAHDPHTIDFCGYDPSWADLPIPLQGTFKKDYGGIALFGPCPRCKHDDGINIFIPTTWATVTTGGSPGSSFVSAALSQGTERVLQWQGSDQPATGPEAQAPEVVEVVVCRCGDERLHKPPSGRSGCGYWGYLHLHKGTIPDD